MRPCGLSQLVRKRAHSDLGHVRVVAVDGVVDGRQLEAVRDALAGAQLVMPSVKTKVLGASRSSRSMLRSAAKSTWSGA